MIGQPSTKLVGRSNNKSSKIIYIHNNQLSDIQNQKICKIWWQNIKCGESKKYTHPHILLYVNFMMTTSQKYIIDTHAHTSSKNKITPSEEREVLYRKYL